MVLSVGICRTFDAERAGVLGDLVNTFPDSFGSHVSLGSHVSVARVLTAPGAGAVAVIAVRLSGSEDPARVFSRFLPIPDRDLGSVPIARIVFGSWGGEDVVVVRPSIAEWEIHCHGGLIAVNRILQDLRDAGVAVMGSYDAGGSEPESLADAALQVLLQCRTRKTASLALGQLDGRLERLLSEVRSECPDEKTIALRHVSRWRSVAEHLAKPWRVAVVGAPNAGKSSLINAIAGLQRSIVSSTPGTTRDLVEVDVVIDGWMFQLIDTAGVREEAQSVIEEIGIENALLAANDCDLLCVVVDVTQPSLEARVLERLARVNSPVCILENKIDLADPRAGSCSMDTAKETWSSATFSDVIRLRVSAVTSEGLPDLLQWIVRSAVPEEPTPETVLPLTCHFKCQVPSEQ